MFQLHTHFTSKRVNHTRWCYSYKTLLRYIKITDFSRIIEHAEIAEIPLTVDENDDIYILLKRHGD